MSLSMEFSQKICALLQQSPGIDPYDDIYQLLREPPTDSEWCSNADNQTLLHVAVMSDRYDCVELLLGAGCPWNAVDSSGKVAAEYSKNDSLYALLLQSAVESEFRNRNLLPPAPSIDYLNGDVTILSDSIVDDDGNAVMMAWETSLMRHHATSLCHLYLISPPPPIADFCLNPFLEQVSNSKSTNDIVKGDDSAQVDLSGVVDVSTREDDISASLNEPIEIHVMNVGFGMGIVDSFINTYLTALQASLSSTLGINFRTHHHIIEAHPGILLQMKERKWTNSINGCSGAAPTLHIHEGRWQSVLPLLGDFKFHGIFFDTFGEDYDALDDFQQCVPHLLARKMMISPGVELNPIYSFFNGLGGTNPFFHNVYCHILAIDLDSYGISIEYVDYPVEARDWTKVRKGYFTLPTYRLPICHLMPPSASQAE